MYILLTILVTILIIESFFKNTNIYKNLFNHINETFNNKFNTVINRNDETIYNDKNNRTDDNVNIKLNLKAGDNDFNLESKTKEVMNSMKNADFKKIITDLTGFIRNQTLPQPDISKMDVNSQEYQDFLEYLSKQKFNPVIKKNCEQTIIDVSYPKMYFRNDYNIKKNRLKFTEY